MRVRVGELFEGVAQAGTEPLLVLNGREASGMLGVGEFGEGVGGGAAAEPGGEQHVLEGDEGGQDALRWRQALVEQDVFGDQFSGLAKLL